MGENKRDGRSGGERWGSGGGRRENRRKRAKEVLAVRKAWERNGVLAATLIVLSFRLIIIIRLNFFLFIALKYVLTSFFPHF